MLEPLREIKANSENARFNVIRQIFFLFQYLYFFQSVFQTIKEILITFKHNIFRACDMQASSAIPSFCYNFLIVKMTNTFSLVLSDFSCKRHLFNGLGPHNVFQNVASY